MRSALGADPIGINARDLATFAIDREAQLALVAAAPRDRVVVAESAVHTRAQGAAAELAGADAVLVGTALMRAADPPARLREILSRPLVKVCGLTRDGGRRVAVEAGADLCGFVLEPASPRAAERCCRRPRDGALGRRLRRRGRRSRTPTSSSSTSARRDASAAATPCSCAKESRSRRWSTCPGRTTTRPSSSGPRAVEGRLVLAGGLAPRTSRAAIGAARPWAVDASSSLEREPGIKDHDRVRAFVAAARG